jgi:hypothetical protein
MYFCLISRNMKISSLLAILFDSEAWFFILCEE